MQREVKKSKNRPIK